MNILHLQNELSKTSGVARHIYLLCKNSPPEYNNHLISFNIGNPKRFPFIGVKVNYLIKTIKIFKPIQDFLYILRYCQRNKINIIHSHHRYFAFLAFCVSKIEKISTVMTVHSIVYGKKQLSYRANVLIVPSEAVKKHLVRYFNQTKQRIITKNYFLDPEDIVFTKEPEELKHNLQILSYKIISFFGRFDHEKGFDFLIKAINEILSNKIKVIFLLVGSGEKEYLLNDLNPDIKKFVRVLPPQENIYDYYNISDMIILPSRVDPFPFVMLEAGIMKVPFIGSAVDGIKELIIDKENGFLFNPGNINQLCEKILFCLDNPDTAKKYADNLYNVVLKKCNKENYISFIKQLYSDLTENRK